MIFCGISRKDGQALLLRKRAGNSLFWLAQELSYDELRNWANRSISRHDLTGLTKENWREYCVMQPGDQIVFAYSVAGEGPYHEETRCFLRAEESGYLFVNEVLSPMGGSYSNKSPLPTGFCYHLTVPQLKEYFCQRIQFIPEDKLELSETDLKQLIETDYFRMTGRLLSEDSA